MKLAVGSDLYQNSLDLKDHLVQFFESWHNITDCSLPFGRYPTIAQRVGLKVAKGKFQRGILICKTGIGMSIVANKVKGIRAVLGLKEEVVQLAVRRNNCNILCLGATLLPLERALDLAKLFLKEEYEGESTRNLKLIEALERRNFK